MSNLVITDKCKRIDNLTDNCKKHRYEKSKLLELRKNKKCQEWPKVLNKRYIGIDGKWDPVGAFQTSTFPQRTQTRDDIQHVYNERYRKRQRDDYKYYYYGESTKRYSSSYGVNYSNYYPTNSKQRYQYEEDIVYESTRNRSSTSDYYPSYSYQSSKSRISNDKDHPEEPVIIDSKPEWFTGGPSNINETIELSGMSRELEAGILKNRKSTKRNEDNFSQTKNSSPKSSSNATYSNLNKDENDDLDSHLMKIIKNNAKENDKRKYVSTAKEVEKVLKSILLRPNEEGQEPASLSQNSNGVVRTVNEIEANLKLKGNRGAGDMSAYYKLLGLVQTGNDTHGHQSETSTNNNHPRQVPDSKYTLPNTTKIANNSPVTEVDLVFKTEELTVYENKETEIKETPLKCDESIEFEKLNVASSEIISPKPDDNNHVDMKKCNGYNNYNMHSTNNALRNERLAMASRNMSQFSNHMLGTGQMGQNAYRWIRAMNNAAAASARITQMNQQEYGVSPETSNANWDPKQTENKQECESGVPVQETNSMDVFNANFDNNMRANIEQSNSANHMNNYLNSLNVNNYMNQGSSLFSQLSMKQFLPFGYHSQNSMFGRQFLNPYLLQQLFMHKQWENRNFSLQNQLRQYQSMNFSPQQNVNNALNNPAYSPASALPLNQGDCSAIGINK